MLEDQINYLLPEEDLSTDEDDMQSLTPEDVCPHKHSLLKKL
jgi:hypothetical protein